MTEVWYEVVVILYLTADGSVFHIWVLLYALENGNIYSITMSEYIWNDNAEHAKSKEMYSPGNRLYKSAVNLS